MFDNEPKWTANTTAYLDTSLRDLAVAVRDATNTETHEIDPNAALQSAVANTVDRLRRSGWVFAGFGLAKAVTMAPIAMVLRCCGRSLFKKHDYQNVWQNFQLAQRAREQADVLQQLNPTEAEFRDFLRTCEELHLATQNHFIVVHKAAKRARDQSLSLLIGGGALVGSVVLCCTDVPSLFPFLAFSLGTGVLLKAVRDRLQDNREGHLATKFDPIGRAIKNVQQFHEDIKKDLKLA